MLCTFFGIRACRIFRSVTTWCRKVSRPRSMIPPSILVSVARAATASYPQHAPYHPPECFPEGRRLGGESAIDIENHVYSAVRESLFLLGLDRERWGGADWNPFGGFIQPGTSVLV